MNREVKVAQALLNIGAVKLNPKEPFTWTSGIKSPIYCDNRLIISHPETRNFIIDSLVALIREQFPEVEVIAGTATAGIPHAAVIAHQMNLPMIYVRSAAKGHGTKSAIEGRLPENAKVVMIEDLISTGKSVIEAAGHVEASGAKVIGCVAIFNYLLQVGKEAFANKSYPLFTLSNYRVLIDEATQSEHLKEYKTTLEEWYQAPETWGQ